MTPTADQFSSFQKLFKYYNTNSFDGQLPDVFLNFSRKKGAAGFFSSNRWKYVDGSRAHEISINPQSLSEGKKYLIETLVHEMCHLWQNEFGKPSRRTYHNKAWADKMESIGLMPSNTGQPGGKRTGQKMSDYMIEGGKLEKLMIDMPDNHWLPLTSIEIQRTAIHNNNTQTLSEVIDNGVALSIEDDPNEKKKKIKYSCPTCSMNVWGKPDLNVVCGNCETRLESSN